LGEIQIIAPAEAPLTRSICARDGNDQAKPRQREIPDQQLHRF